FSKAQDRRTTDCRRSLRFHGPEGAMQCRRRRLAPPLSALARSILVAAVATAAEVAGRTPRGHWRRFGGGHWRSRWLWCRAALWGGPARRLLLLGRSFR